MATQPENIVEHLHNEAYGVRYNQQNLNHATMICDAGRPREQLNGVWNFSVDAYDHALRSQSYLLRRATAEGRPIPWDFAPDEGESIRVPSCWNMHRPEYLYYEGSAWYSRRFTYFPNRDDERVVLRVGAANYDTKIFLNQTFLGNHYGGSTPFFVELTEYITQENLLQCCVNNDRTADRVPMKNTDWFNYGGMYRDIELIRLPRDFIKEFHIALVPDHAFDKIAMTISVSDDAAQDDVRVRIPDLGLDQSVALTAGKAEIVITAEPELWSPEQPTLYDVDVSFRQDRIRDRVGFRQIHVDGTRIVLNGKPLFLRGISVHEDDVQRGKMADRDDILHCFQQARELGCNFLRLTHYPHHEMTAKLADEAGLLLWEEIPVYWAIDFENPATYADARNQLLELITRDMNRASVILWSVGNENADTDARLKFMEGLAQTAKSADPTRLVSAACLVNTAKHAIEDRLISALDVIGLNEYYGWYEPDCDELAQLLTNSDPEKPVIITETGAGALAGHHGSITDLFTEEQMESVYRKQIELIRKIEYVQGMSPWILYDFRTPRRCNRFQQGFNRKGLIAEDKTTRKLAFSVLQRFYQEKIEEAEAE